MSNKLDAKWKDEQVKFLEKQQQRQAAAGGGWVSLSQLQITPVSSQCMHIGASTLTAAHHATPSKSWSQMIV